MTKTSDQVGFRHRPTIILPRPDHPKPHHRRIRPVTKAFDKLRSTKILRDQREREKMKTMIQEPSNRHFRRAPGRHLVRASDFLNGPRMNRTFKTTTTERSAKVTGPKIPSSDSESSTDSDSESDSDGESSDSDGETGGA